MERKNIEEKLSEEERSKLKEALKRKTGAHCFVSGELCQKLIDFGTLKKDIDRLNKRKGKMETSIEKLSKRSKELEDEIIKIKKELGIQE